MIELTPTVLLKQFKILLIGDVCRDVYHYGSVDRLSPEAPVPIFTLNKVVTKLGMAHNVHDNLKAFNCDVDFSYNTNAVTKKLRLIDERSKQHLIRVDGDVNVTPANLSDVKWKQYDAVVISDYNKGAITEDVITHVQNKFKGPIFVDTKKTDLSKFKKCFIKINALEYSKLTKKNGKIIVTRGSEGAEYKGRLYTTDKVEVVDVCGAGDTFLAALTWGYLITSDVAKAIHIANKCASISVTHSGVYTLTKNDIDSIFGLQFG